jgi:hypothetical protein
MRHDLPELRRDHVEALGAVLADHMHGRPAARAHGSALCRQAAEVEPSAWIGPTRIWWSEASCHSSG